MKLTRALLLIVLPALALGAGGCFTGVESTPRIRQTDVQRQQAAGVTSEQLFLSDIKPVAPAQWNPGRQWLVTNDRISLIFTPASDNTSNLKGHRIFFENVKGATSLTGDDAGEITFRSDDGHRLYYRVPGLTQERVDTLTSLDIPFAVDLDLVSRINDVMAGKRLYVRTPSWYDHATRSAVNGLRHIEVTVDSVVPGDENFPAAVCFSIADSNLAKSAGVADKEYMLYMTAGMTRGGSRSFDTLFAFDNPRNRYPEIQDDVWEYIIRSRIRKNMTRDECRLALGSPPSVERVPTYGGMVERWSYTDGVYLIFEDGYLTRFRQ